MISNYLISGLYQNMYVKFRYTYLLSRNIPFTQISNNVPNVEFVKEGNDLTGFVLSLNKKLNLKEAEKECLENAYILTDLISIKSRKYVIPLLDSYQAFERSGGGHLMKSLILRFDVEGAPTELDLTKTFSNILSSDNENISSYLGYLARASVLQFEHLPGHAIAEAFKIIEDVKTFENYEKYYALRNVISHSPSYSNKTIQYFGEYFDESSFDYRQFEPANNIIILDLNSNKTLRKLNGIFDQMRKGIMRYLQIE